MNADLVLDLIAEIESNCTRLKDELLNSIEPKGGSTTELLATFIAENCHDAPGEAIRFLEFVRVFHSWLRERELNPVDHGKMKIIHSLPTAHPYGIYQSNQRYIGNVSWHPATNPGSPRLVMRNGYLRRN